MMQSTGHRDQSLSVFAELKRRNVFRVALLYIIAGWLVLQLVSILFEQMGIPGWAFRLIFALLIFCLPIVLAFSWVCEITPEGLKREQLVEAETSITTRTGRKITIITVILLVFAILMLVVGQMTPATTTERDSAVIMEPKE